MADSDAKSKIKDSNKTKKRKERTHDEAETLKVQRIESVEKMRPINYGDGNLDPSESQSEELEFGRPWKNLQLILAIQNKQLDAQRFGMPKNATQFRLS